MPVRRTAVLALLAIVALAGLLPIAAASGASGYPTKVIVSLKFPAYHGKLKSKKASCRAGRTVKLFRQRGGKVKLLGRDRSNRKGGWSIPVGKHLTSGAYWAKVTARGRCRAGRSKRLLID